MADIATSFSATEDAVLTGRVDTQADRLKQLSVTGLAAVRGGRCLFSGVGFSLSAGEIMQITGTNGSGKTTLIRMLCGLSPAASGSLRWDYGSGLTSSQSSHNDICYLAHKDAINRSLTPYENVRYYADMHGTGKRETVLAALRTTGLGGFEHTQCSRLSAGQCRRAAIARLLTMPASLWVLDEPLTSLDVDGVEMFETVLSAHLERGGLVIMTTHQPMDLQQHDVRYTELGK